MMALLGRIKQDALDITDLTSNQLHIHVGLAIFVAAALWFRRGMASPWPLAAVILAEAANEIGDRLLHGSWRPANTLVDVALSIFWPCVLFTVARMARS